MGIRGGAATGAGGRWSVVTDRSARIAELTRLIESEVLAIIVEAGHPADTFSRAFAELSWDSLSAVELQFRLQQHLGREIEPELLDAADIDELAGRLADLGSR